MSLRKTKVYAFALDYLRSRGLKVYHKKMINLDGSFDAQTNQIDIDKDYRGTVMGVYILFHEMRHFLQKEQRLFPHFMAGYNKYKDEYMDEVVVAEQDAAKFSQRMMRALGLKYNPDELNLKELPRLKEFWRKHYFPKERKSKKKV